MLINYCGKMMRLFQAAALLILATCGAHAATPVSFNAPRAYTATFPVFLALGDFNRDGKLDLVVADSSAPGFVSIMLANPNGTFQKAVSYVVGNDPSSVAVGDFDGDGKLDLAVANGGSVTVSILLGNGDGTFQPATNYAVGKGPISVALGDFNGDGKPDMVVANNGSNTVSIDSCWAALAHGAQR